jgi:drug/metabolite transporter (DMT)-like permease
MLASMELPVALLGAFFILGEQVLPVQWAGMALILLGIAVSETGASTPARRTEADRRT